MFPSIPSLLDVPQTPQTCPPMNKDQTNIMLQLIFSDMDKEVEFSAENAELFGFSAKVMHERLKMSGTKVTFPCATMAVSLCQSVGDVVLWAYTLNRMFAKKKSIITISDLCQYFPMGFPTKEEMDKIWNAQKGYNNNVKVDNIIDQMEVWNCE